MRKWVLPLFALVLSACAAVITPRPPEPPIPPPSPLPREVVATVRDPNGNVVTSASSVTLVDDATPQHSADCAWGRLSEPRLYCLPGEGIVAFTGGTLTIRVDGYAPWVGRVIFGQDRGEIRLDDLDPPIVDKTVFIRTYQGNFGGIKLPGCGLHLDNLFDPFLLIKWLEDRSCYEQMMQAHADRGDNVVVVDPRSGYHGHNDVDVWHQPDVFASFLRDIRRHTNKYGEHFRTLVFFAGDGHIGNMRDPGAFDHWRQDVDALAAVAENAIDSTSPCWECRHQNDYVSANLYYQMLEHLAMRLPRATHGVHLIKNSSSPSSWRCDPQIPGSCASPSDGPDPNDADDPARGNEIGAWVYMRQRGLVDVFYYQFQEGEEYVNMDAYPPDPSNGGQRGAARRYWEVAVRLGDDPWSNATMRLAHPNGDHFGWPVQLPIIAFEFIYDFYWDRGPDEAMQVKRCQQFLAIGGWGCGSASWRRPS